MATQKTYTQEQLKKAQEALEALPDLSRDKITKPDFIDSLREQIITLSSSKGYSQAEIKSALASVGVIVSIQAISDLIGSKQNRGLGKPLKPNRPESFLGLYLVLRCMLDYMLPTRVK